MARAKRAPDAFRERREAMRARRGPLGLVLAFGLGWSVWRTWGGFLFEKGWIIKRSSPPGPSWAVLGCWRVVGCDEERHVSTRRNGSTAGT